MHNDMRHSAHNIVSGAAALVLLGGSALGLLIFGLMVLTSYPYGNYEFTLIGLAGIGGILVGLYCFFCPPRYHGGRASVSRPQRTRP